MPTPTLSGLHHVTMLVTDLHASADWYAAALLGERLPRLDHHDSSGALEAVVLRLPGLPVPVKLQRAPEAPAAVRGYDPVTLAVSDVAELHRWIAHLDACGVPHSVVTPARIGHTLSLTDPDGTLIRLYTEPVSGLDDVPFTET